jgi:hypothetical protein
MVAAARRSTVDHGIARVLMLESRALKTANALIAKTTDVNPSNITANARSCHQKCEATTHIKLNTKKVLPLAKKERRRPFVSKLTLGVHNNLMKHF